jgi:hypothetical protein
MGQDGRLTSWGRSCNQTEMRKRKERSEKSRLTVGTKQVTLPLLFALFTTSLKSVKEEVRHKNTAEVTRVSFFVKRGVYQARFCFS